MTRLWFESYSEFVLPEREETDGPRSYGPRIRTARRGGADRVGPRPGSAAQRPRGGDAGLQAAVVEVRRSQGSGHPRTVRHVDDPVLPGAEYTDRQARGAGARPDAGQASSPDQGCPSSIQFGAVVGCSRLSPSVPSLDQRITRSSTVLGVVR